MRGSTIGRGLALVGVLGMLSACGATVVQGRVIPGPVSEIAFVTPDDPRLTEPGLSGVRVEIVRDPGRGNQRVVATASSASSGGFSIPLDEFGAGWMEEQWLIRASRYQHQPAEWLGELPSDDSLRLLVMLAPGRGGTLNREDDLMEQYERFR